MPDWKTELNYLLDTYYAGVGGKTMLAEDLTVSRMTVYNWLGERVNKSTGRVIEPDYYNRKAIHELYLRKIENSG